MLAIHSATASFKQEPRYFEILGGRFRVHGAIQTFEVSQTQSAEDVFGHVAPFQIKDELYIHELAPEIAVHFEAMHDGEPVPVVWTRRYGAGRVCYAMPGHTAESMQAPHGAPYLETRPGVGMSKLRLGIVGCGDIAGFTAWVSKLVPQVQLAACCDVNAERAQTFARRHGIRQVFTDYAQLLASAPLDAVYLAVPHHLHYEMILAAVEAGKPVLVEKPLTRTLAEGTQLVEALKQPGVKVGVNYQYRYDSGCYALARAVQQEALGKVHVCPHQCAVASGASLL